MAKKKITPISKHSPKKNLFELGEVKLSLTDRQKLFCMEYISSKFNGAEAARKAGYEPNNARQQADHLLTNTYIVQYIELLKKDLGLRMGITQERIAGELAKIAFFNVADILNDDGTLKSLDGLDRDLTANISSVEVVELISNEKVLGQIKKIKMNDKQTALLGLNKMLGYDAPIKTDLTITNGPKWIIPGEETE